MIAKETRSCGLAIIISCLCKNREWDSCLLNANQADFYTVAGKKTPAITAINWFRMIAVVAENAKKMLRWSNNGFLLNIDDTVFSRLLELDRRI